MGVGREERTGRKEGGQTTYGMYLAPPEAERAERCCGSIKGAGIT